MVPCRTYIYGGFFLNFLRGMETVEVREKRQDLALFLNFLRGMETFF